MNTFKWKKKKEKKKSHTLKPINRRVIISWQTEKRKLVMIFVIDWHVRFVSFNFDH